MKNCLSEIFGEERNPTTIIQNPFKKECIKSIYLHAFRWDGVFEGRIDFEGSVSFKSGNTEAEQKFKANSLPELYMQIQQFCESL